MIHHRMQSLDDSELQRDYLISSDAIAQSMVLSLSSLSNRCNANSAPSALMRVDGGGKVSLIMPRIEVREGIYASLRVLIAGEIEVAPQLVDFEYAPKETFIAHAMFHILATGNSIAVRGILKQLGVLGATARVMLIAAAAERWGVDAKSCGTCEGEVIHAPTSRKLKYGDLVRDAAHMPVPMEV